jgi:hypothetical protein
MRLIEVKRTWALARASPAMTHMRVGRWLRGHQYAKSPKQVDRSTTHCENAMQKPPLDPDVADTAPSDSVLTVYDEEHTITYLRLLDADVEGADWREVARIVLHLDPEHESDRARGAFDSHLLRAKWMTEHGYRLLLRGVASA